MNELISMMREISRKFGFVILYIKKIEIKKTKNVHRTREKRVYVFVVFVLINHKKSIT